MVAAAWRFLRVQRLPAGRLPIRRPALESAVFLTYALVFVGLAILTGLAIRAQPRPILGASYFTSDLVYVVAFKFAGLLVVPLGIAALLGFGAREIFAGDRLDRRTIVGIILAFLVGASLNQQHLRQIPEAALHFSGGALTLRVGLGLLIPLLSAALPEEIVYRGILQPRLERVAGRATAILLTALLFTAWHLPTRFLLASGVEGRAGDLASVLVGTGLPVFVVGLFFGLIYDRYRRLLPLIAAHWGIDAAVGVATMLGLPM